MKKLPITILIMLINISFFVLIFTGCPQGGDMTPGVDDTLAAEELVNEAVELLRADDWDGALSKFSQALLKDSTNGEAQIGYAFLNIASIAVDPQMVTLVQSRLNFQDYPGDMNTLFFGHWVNMEVVTGSSIIEDMEGNIIEQINYFSTFPAINIPASIAEWEDEDASVITGDEYMLAFLYNFVTANPNGLNILVEGVIDDVLGPRLDMAIMAIQGLDDNANMTFTYDMFTDSSDPPDFWPRDAANNPMGIKIGKAEILTEGSLLQSLKSFLQLVNSYDLTLPLTDYYAAFNSLDGDFFAETLDWDTLTSPLAAGFLTEKAEAAQILAEAKTAMLGAVTNFATAMEAIAADRPGMFISSGNPIFPDPSCWDVLVDMMNFSKNVATEIQISIEDNVNMFIPLNTVPEDSEFFYATYADEANWPTASDWGTGWTEMERTPPTALGFNFASAFTGSFLAVNNLIELETTGDNLGEPLLYRVSYTVAEASDQPNHATSITLDDSAPVTSVDPQEDNVVYAFKIKDITLGGLLDSDANFVTKLESAINSFTNITDLASQLLVVNEDDSISLYIPQLPPIMAYETLAAAGEPLTIQYAYMPEAVEYTTTGSFYWALPFLDTFFPVIDSEPFGGPEYISLTSGISQTGMVVDSGEITLFEVYLNSGLTATVSVSNCNGDLAVYTEDEFGNMWDIDFPATGVDVVIEIETGLAYAHVIIQNNGVASVTYDIIVNEI